MVELINHTSNSISRKNPIRRVFPNPVTYIHLYVCGVIILVRRELIKFWMHKVKDVMLLHAHYLARNLKDKSGTEMIYTVRHETRKVNAGPCWQGSWSGPHLISLVDSSILWMWLHGGLSPGYRYLDSRWSLHVHWNTLLKYRWSTSLDYDTLTLMVA